jgi:hypothetical protein
VSWGGCGGGGGVVETSIAGIAAALWFSRLGRLSIQGSRSLVLYCAQTFTTQRSMLLIHRGEAEKLC